MASTEPKSFATNGIAPYAILACGTTWLLAIPASVAWLHHAQPSPLAVACAGLSAFGPLLAALVVAGRQHQLGPVFGRWRTNVLWVLLALLIAPLIHLLATAAFVALGGVPDSWFHPPNTPEAVAALVVFPIGEEFGWRGFLHPRATQRFGMVVGSLLVGSLWGLWHLGYSVTPTGFDPLGFGLGMLELPLYSLPIAWVFERSNRSMAVAIAFHASAHLDHIERAPRTDLRLWGLHLAIVAVVAVIAAGALRRSAPLEATGDLTSGRGRTANQSEE